LSSQSPSTTSKDGWSRKAQIAIYSAWIVFVAIAIVVVLVMQPDAPTPTQAPAYAIQLTSRKAKG
jgi:hypothetical protein